jgi:hypothetical protein
MTSKPRKGNLLTESESVQLQAQRWVMDRTESIKGNIRDKNLSTDELIDACARLLLALEMVEQRAPNRQVDEFLLSVLASRSENRPETDPIAWLEQFGADNLAASFLLPILRQTGANSRSKAAQKAAQVRHAYNPAKDLVRGEWVKWKAGEAVHKNQAAFAQAMLRMWPRDLTNPQVIEGWCRAWKKDVPAA